MANLIKEELKVFFQTNKKPTEAQFASLIDSSLNGIDDKATDSDAQNESVDNKFLTPKTAKKSVLAFAPVKSVNGIGGDVTIPPQTSVTGNAGTATKLATPRNINGVPFDGTSDITIPTGEASSNKYVTDFLQGNTFQFPFSGGNVTSVGSATSVLVAEQNHPGQVLLKKSAAINTGYYVGTHAFSMVISPNCRYDVIVKFPAALTTGKVFRFGFNGSASTTETANGVYFELLNGNLVAKTAKTSVRTSIPLLDPSLNVWYHCSISFDASMAAKFEVYSDAGVLLASTIITTNMPIGRACGAIFTAHGTSNVEEELCILDYMSLDLGEIVRGKQ